jgi:hypothetical protein
MIDLLDSQSGVASAKNLIRSLPFFEETLSGTPDIRDCPRSRRGLRQVFIYSRSAKSEEPTLKRNNMSARQRATRRSSQHN